VEGYRFNSITLRGWKFKKGTECVYIGQSATYLGPYSQITDDEDHTFKRGIPFEICTDTAAKLRLPPYAGQFEIHEPSQPKKEVESCAPGSCC